MQTFLVRIWTPGVGEAGDVPAGIRGVVEHLASRRRRPFDGEHDLAGFIHDCLHVLQGHQEGQLTQDAAGATDPESEAPR